MRPAALAPHVAQLMCAEFARAYHQQFVGALDAGGELQLVTIEHKGRLQRGGRHDAADAVLLRVYAYRLDIPAPRIGHEHGAGMITCQNKWRG